MAAQVWREGLPATERDLCLAGLGFFTFRVDPDVAAGRSTSEQAAALERGDLDALVRAGVLHPEPIVYEDFLPRSAAGIFASNLTDGGTVDADQGGADRDAGWMADVIGTDGPRPRGALRAGGSASLREVGTLLGLDLRARGAQHLADLAAPLLARRTPEPEPVRDEPQDRRVRARRSAITPARPPVVANADR